MDGQIQTGGEDIQKMNNMNMTIDQIYQESHSENSNGKTDLCNLKYVNEDMNNIGGRCNLIKLEPLKINPNNSKINESILNISGLNTINNVAPNRDFQTFMSMES